MIARLDGLLGRVTMYLLVLGWLVVIALVAIVLALAGQLSYDPLGIVASAWVLVLTSVVSNALVGLVLRMRPQLMSAAITGMLLLLILPPTADPAGWGPLALAALIATASKYLLAWRGRHIFNPAAVAAFVITLTQLTFAAWWVATPSLLPVVLLGALLVLYRTRRLGLGAVFVVVAALAWGVSLLRTGGAFLDGVQLALLQLPAVYVAGFMLSEPLTLPPRRWQQLTEGAIVGVLFGTAWSAGIFSASPELALLVGNLFAFVVTRRRGIRLEFVGRRALTPTSWEFAFRPLRPVAFAPGQYMELTLPHRGADARGGRRVFSIASAPGDELRFGIRLPERASSFKRALLELAPGTRISATGVAGDFVLPRADRKLLMVAGGIGITPFVGHLAEAGGRDVALVYAVSRPDDVAYVAELTAAGIPVTIAAPGRPEGIPAAWQWIDTTGLDAGVRIDGARLLSAVPDAHERETLLSGPPAMIAELRTALRRAGARRIRTDAFIGY